MKFVLPTVMALAASVVLVSAQAQQVVGLSPSSEQQLELFKEPGKQSESRMVAVNDLGLPLDIRSSQKGFHEVMIQGELVWVRSTKVRINKSSAANCMVVTSGPQTATNSTPGLGSNGC